jgi:hypothetical protein
MEKNSFSEVTQITLNILLIMGGFSALLFFVGYENYKTYYSVLGININFLELQSFNYVINGFSEFFPLAIFFLPLIFYFYYSLYEIRSIKKELIQLINLSEKFPEYKDKATLLTKKLEIIEGNEKFILNNFWIKFKKPQIVFFLVSLIVGIIAFIYQHEAYTKPHCLYSI